jgi:hypothetical protein
MILPCDCTIKVACTVENRSQPQVVRANQIQNFKHLSRRPEHVHPAVWLNGDFRQCRFLRENIGVAILNH